jgi:bacteriocin biosynthesis cyclodehydratase domain-containing protein
LENNQVPQGDDAVLRISDGLDFVLISDNELLIQFGTRSYPSELFRDTDLTGILGKLARRLLSGPATLSDLLQDLAASEANQADARALVNNLLERGFITEVKKSPIDQYIAYTFTGKSRLEQCIVNLIGMGPLGIRLAYSLVQHGVGRLMLVDNRRADELWWKNLPLKAASSPSGSDFVHVLVRDQLRAAGYTAVEALETELEAPGIEAAVTGSDLTVVAFEQPDLRTTHLVNRLCIQHRKPWLLATIDGNFGIIGPLFVPPHTACYNDFTTLSEAATRTPQMTRRYRQHIMQRRASSFFPGLPVYAEIVSGYACLAALHFLSRESSFAIGRVLIMDFDRMIIDVEDVLKIPRCPVCGEGTIAHQPPFSAEIVTRYASLKARFEVKTGDET